MIKIIEVCVTFLITVSTLTGLSGFIGMIICELAGKYPSPIHNVFKYIMVGGIGTFLSISVVIIFTLIIVTLCEKLIKMN